MSSDDENTTDQPKPRHQQRSNTQSFELISLSSHFSRQYHQVFVAPPSSNTSPTKNSSLGYTTSTLHYIPFGKVNQLGTHATTPTFTPSPHIPLQTITPTPIYTMEVNNSSWKIQKFNGRSSTISLREFKEIFSIVVCELELKYGVNYTKVFAFKQLTHYVHYEALDVYEQHFVRILGITQIPDPDYAIAIATTSQATLQATITHHGIVPNNQIQYLLE